MCVLTSRHHQAYLHLLCSSLFPFLPSYILFSFPLPICVSPPFPFFPSLLPFPYNYFFLMVLAVLCGRWSLGSLSRDGTPCPLCWEHEVLTTEPSGKFYRIQDLRISLHIPMINQNDNLMPKKDTKDKTNPRQKSPKELVIDSEVTD